MWNSQVWQFESNASSGKWLCSNGLHLTKGSYDENQVWFKGEEEYLIQKI